jgi:hypothetical protein
LSNLTKLSLAGNDTITNEALPRLPSLIDLTITGSSITDDAVSGLVNLLALRQRRGYLDPHLSDSGISGLTQLTELEIEGNSAITDAGVQPLTNLTCLVFTKQPFEPETRLTLNGLQGLTKLRRIELFRGLEQRGGGPPMRFRNLKDMLNWWKMNNLG